MFQGILFALLNIENIIKQDLRMNFLLCEHNKAKLFI
jgi:hypothetical protein